ncbi:hypothetical protein A3Q56_00185 [Intoshia linei]|uniref:Protein kinase domain-containing protein n=1 Tax=Intoshia linei TaxID=1819745 RepID=A0A177BED6_9BILA|nr:hypothetical protein A3Q56_00185 [Intoshia linei]
MLSQSPIIITKKYDLFSTKITLLDNIIGSGAYGCVYIGIYQCHKVALKTFKETNSKCIENFMIESAIMAKLCEENYLLKQIGVSILDNRIYFVTPYMNCGDLNNYLKSNPGTVSYGKSKDNLNSSFD